MVAANLLRGAAGVHGALRVHLTERRSVLGQGAAYSTRNDEHLLNVPARGMSAWSDRPDDFLAWARRERPDTAPGDFLPRSLYARYLRETLETAAATAPAGATLETAVGEVTRIERKPDRSWIVHCTCGKTVHAEIVVLASGHRAPGDPLHGRWQGPRDRWIADPWRPDALAAIGPDDAVAIIGTGLTAMDVLLTLCKQPSSRRPPIHLISRSGLLPRAHALAPSPPADMLPLLNELALTGRVTSVRALLRAVRTATQGRGATPALHADWRAVIDGLRSYTHGLWHAMPLGERRRFLRHLRSMWDMHRHRTAPQIGACIDALIASGDVVPHRARPIDAVATAEAVTLRVREHGGDAMRELRSKWLINCSGPTPSVGHADDRAAASLIEAGEARLDALGLGLDTDLMGRPLDRHGRSSGGLWVIGSLRRPALWETTAVPELRVQAEATAQACITTLA